MTMLVAWVGVDQRSPASIYLAADSRLTWITGGPWDYGRKLFAAQSQPHLLAYCGDVLFPTQAISQIIEIIDKELLFTRDTSTDDCFIRILAALTSSLIKYPIAPPAFEILYAARQGSGLNCSFHLYQATFRDGAVQSSNPIPLPSHSDVVAVLGSGTTSFNESYARWQKSDVSGTSRAVFSAFADALTSNTDLQSGGPPQLVGLYRKGGGQTFGIIWKGKRFYYGTDVSSGPSPDVVKWHNELFEICDPKTLQLRDQSQPQPRPRTLDRQG